MKTLRDLYAEHDGKVSDKWDIYLDEYDRILSPYRDKEVRLLEVGVQNGGSLEIWNKYFQNAKVLIGCDINKDCSKLEYDSEKINVIVGDANTDEAEKQIRSICRQFDIIIDDGSHTSKDIIHGFERYFPCLGYGGVFIVEDLHCSYWESYGGGLYDFLSSISFFKNLVDVVNYEHWGLNKSKKEVISIFNEKYGISLALELLDEIHSIEFINSVCVIRKEKPSFNRLGRRNIAGAEELVVPGHEAYKGSYCQPPSQDENDENNIHPATRIKQRDDTIETLHEKASEYEELVKELQDKVATGEVNADQQKQEIGELRNSMSTLETELDQCRQQAARLEHDLGSVLASTSWQFTRPLRGIATIRRKARKVITYPVSAIRLAGGFSPLFRKVLNLYRSEGFKGLARGYRFVADRSQRGDHQADRTYAEWIQHYDLISETDRQRIKADITTFDEKPLISIVMPVYNPNLHWLEQAVGSITSQLYENWELCIADDNSRKPNVRRFLEDLQTRDERIKVTFRESNGHISAASNSALEVATGDWVALMDQDDLLTEHALYWVVKAASENPDAGLIYSDEDKIDERGTRHSPYFKCEWNRSLFYSQNMICHLGVYKRSLMNAVGGFVEGLEGAQDHDLALRIIEQLNDSQIIHVPRVLYHWRVHSKSTAGGADAKPYARIAGENAIQSHLDRLGVKAHVTSNRYGYRVKYDLPDTPPKVSLIIPTRNGLDLVRMCVESIQNKTTYPNYEIILVDNGSDDPSCLEYFSSLEEKYTNFKVKRDDRPFNYSALNNDAVSVAQGEIIGLINNDIEVIDPEWLTEMVGQVVQPNVGAVGAKLLYPNDLVQHAGVIIGYGGVAGHSHLRFRPEDPGYFNRLNVVNEYSAVTAACLIVKKCNFKAVHGLNEQDLKVAFNDVDFCLKLKDLGLRNVWTPHALLYHHESASRGYEDNPEKIARFNSEIAYMKMNWAKYISNDPCYSPNLTLDREDFSLAWPPRVGGGNVQ